MRRLPLLACLLLALGGCGQTENAPPTGTVRGRVLLHGRPLAGGRVVFVPHPDRGPVGPRASAEIDPNGEFRLSAGGSHYLTPGWYRVAIADPPTTANPFPPALRRPDLSGLEREVIAGRDNVYEFHIEVR